MGGWTISDHLVVDLAYLPPLKGRFWPGVLHFWEHECLPRCHERAGIRAGVGRERMGKHAQLLQQEDVVVLSAVLHEARAAALASSTSTADGDVELSLLEVGELEHTSSST